MGQFDTYSPATKSKLAQLSNNVYGWQHKCTYIIIHMTHMYVHVIVKDDVVLILEQGNYSYRGAQCQIYHSVMKDTTAKIHNSRLTHNTHHKYVYAYVNNTHRST